MSHVDDLAHDPAAALFAGLTSLPKATALTTYSYRLDHTRQAAFLTAFLAAFLAALDKATIAAGLTDADMLNLDFHAIMHWGQDAALEKNYVPRRSQRTRSVLTFFAEDAASHTLLYANADLSKATQSGEILAFCNHWHTVTGRDPTLLIFDSKVTTQAEWATLTQRGIGFITLRPRNTKLTATLAAAPANTWTPVTVDRAGSKTRKVHVLEDPTATLHSYPGTLRQLAITGLGHDQPTILVTNGVGPLADTSAKKIIEHYAQRMNIEQRLAES
ncbi:MAG TPA: hypothetical protein VFC19_00525, partial [Candidatus Limnocylindrales bacterium]|nr:hypothetical protein [Candidatus Limnocylindrales bacterium]